MQFIPGYNNIWVAQLNPEDPIYEYEVESDAVAKAEELQSQDPSGRQYKAQSLIVAEEVLIEEPLIEETITDAPSEEIITEEVTQETPVVEEITEEVSQEAPTEETSTEEIPTEEPTV
jgi:hypothetical protein